MDRPVRIRHAKPAEFPGVLRCLSEAFEPYRAAYTTLAFLDTVLSPEALFERSRSMTILVALTDDDELVGTVACSAGDAARGHIRGMAVRPAWQGLGIAKALLDEAVEAVRLRQCTTVTLDTTLPLRRAIGFYESNMFRATGHIADFFGMPLHEYARAIGDPSAPARST